ncbi:cytochrome b561 and DOMON domain-containing protein At3g61750 [Physcomitrium patens]|uniref:Cytochrome b561 and DOMON domain-containing protein n=1 Tax=Physcomitrium patens TaxID=3218 RepID=A0A2K1JMR3_PHYPA|nr:cytochrome b561 and DOMON domain-containing protein At3g61750-like [Physcomitrium patens]PNR42819.1 hypothetical protein PHYPA_017650 [Physcomitrium patens]|eukprot:XP_024392891.1 cytochrome b561 and DOMON domain-containing protein At3g61750-like [Physcomitrella patens]
MGTRGAGGLSLLLGLLLGVTVAVLVLALPVSSQATNVGCAADLKSKVTKFQTQSLHCKAYNFPAINPYIIWALKDNVTNITSMVVSMPLSPNQWAGLGFSADGQMVGSTALIATLSSSGVPIVKVYKLNSRSTSGVVEDASGLSFVGGPADAVYDQGRTVYVSFQLNLAKSTAGSRFFLMAYGPTSLDGQGISQHVDRISLSAQFVTGVMAGESTASKLAKKSKIHASLQILGWGLLLPIGAMVARYARSFDPAWFYTHIAFQFVGFACIIAGLVTGFELLSHFQHDHLTAHKWIGIFITVVAFGQLSALLYRPHKDSKRRKYWIWMHSWFGRMALFLAAVNILLGLWMAKAEKDFRVSYIAILIIELVAFIFLELFLWVRWYKQQRRDRQSSNAIPPFQFGGSV